MPDGDVLQLRASGLILVSGYNVQMRARISGQAIDTVNARDLHAFLEVGKDFTNWIKDRIERYGFIENQDFVIGSPVLANQARRGGDRRSKEYHITIDMAKELSMVERNEKGKQARQYFIECERTGYRRLYQARCF